MKSKDQILLEQAYETVSNLDKGWTNRQTYIINLRFYEAFLHIAEEQTFDDVDQLADAFESHVREIWNPKDSKQPLADAEYLDQVNWKELAQRIARKLNLF